MEQEVPNSQRRKSEHVSLAYGISFAWQIGFLIVVPVLGFTGGGFLLDKWLGTLPFLTIVGAILAFAISMYEIVHMVRPILEKSRKELENEENPKSQ